MKHYKLHIYKVEGDSHTEDKSLIAENDLDDEEVDYITDYLNKRRAKYSLANHIEGVIGDFLDDGTDDLPYDVIESLAEHLSKWIKAHIKLTRSR